MRALHVVGVDFQLRTRFGHGIRIQQQGVALLVRDGLRGPRRHIHEPVEAGAGLAAHDALEKLLGSAAGHIVAHDDLQAHLLVGRALPGPGKVKPGARTVEVYLESVGEADAFGNDDGQHQRLSRTQAQQRRHRVLACDNQLLIHLFRRILGFR